MTIQERAAKERQIAELQRELDEDAQHKDEIQELFDMMLKRH